MQNSLQDDKTGDELSQQRFHMLEDIARELQGEVVFPICFDVAIRIREVIDDERQPVDKIVSVVSLDPLIAAKLLLLANSVLYNPQGREVKDLKGAISRLGLKTVRATALSIAMRQLLRSRDMVDFSDMANSLWVHSLLTASAAYVVASRMTRLNPDEAMLAGLVHDLGAFYMLYRAAQYPELRARPDTVRYLVAQWHESIGLTLLAALGLPENIVEATRDHDQKRTAPEVPLNLNDIVYVGNMLAGGGIEWLQQDADPQVIFSHLPGTVYQALEGEIQERARSMRAAFD